MCNNGKGEAHSHPARITFYWLINEVAYIREGDYIVVTRRNFFVCKTKDRSIKVYIFSTREFRIETASQFKKSCNAPITFHRSRRGGQRSGDNLEQCAFSGTIATDNANTFPTFYFK